MDALTAKPNLLKQANLSLIRKVIRTKGTVTRAEIADEVKTSSTTIRSLLAEMQRNGEIESIGYDESSGGRKAERYRFKPDRYHCVAFCITDNQMHGLLVNICGEIIEVKNLEVSNRNYLKAIIAYLDDIVSKREIKSIGLGVPGIVEGGSFLKKYRYVDELCRVEIGDIVAQRYGIPVIMENDLNATAIGFGRCYQKEYPCEDPENTNMAYIHFECGCISAGFIAGGRIIRGCKQFAGELGLIPAGNDELLDDRLAQASDDKQFIQLVVQVIGWICGILNPQYVALGGPEVRKDCIGPIADGLFALLPKNMFAEILYAPDVWNDYHEGMAHLTAGKMFDEVHFIKE